MKAGNEKIKRYSRDDLELLTRSNGGNAYHSAEEWETDGEGGKKLICIDKWWRGPNVSIGIIFAKTCKHKISWDYI